MPVDFKKTEKELYQPSTAPSIIDVPEMAFIMIDGSGDPNMSDEYKTALEILYGLSYGIKMSKMESTQPDGYFEYVMPPLEGLWWHVDGGEIQDYTDKASFCWTSMIRQPDFVTAEVFASFARSLAKKKPGLDLSLARLEKFTEGLCVQAMHVGSYDQESATIAAMERYAGENGFATDLSGTRRHHEIYLSDPRKSKPENMKTVIRHPVRKI